MRTALEVPKQPRCDQLKERIREIDERLAILRPEENGLREEIDKLISREQRALRLFAEGDKREKQQIDRQLSEMLERRASLEREAKALSIAIAELDEERRQIYPEFQQLQLEEQQADKQRKIEALREAHNRDLENERACDRALVEAREKTDRSYWAWRAAVDQEAVTEQLAATEQLRADWQRNSGPNAPGNKR